MSQQQIQQVTLAAISEWAASSSKETFKNWVKSMKAGGRYWGSEEEFDEVPCAE